MLIARLGHRRRHAPGRRRRIIDLAARQWPLVIVATDHQHLARGQQGGGQFETRMEHAAGRGPDAGVRIVESASVRLSGITDFMTTHDQDQTRWQQHGAMFIPTQRQRPGCAPRRIDHQRIAQASGIERQRHALTPIAGRCRDLPARRRATDTPLRVDHPWRRDARLMAGDIAHQQATITWAGHVQRAFRRAQHVLETCGRRGAGEMEKLLAALGGGGVDGSGVRVGVVIDQSSLFVGDRGIAGTQRLCPDGQAWDTEGEAIAEALGKEPRRRHRSPARGGRRHRLQAADSVAGTWPRRRREGRGDPQRRGQPREIGDQCSDRAGSRSALYRAWELLLEPHREHRHACKHARRQHPTPARHHGPADLDWE